VRTLGRYIVLELPGWIATIFVLSILAQFDVISFRVGAILLGLLVLKDFLLYPFVRRAYEPAGATRVDDLVGAIGEVRRDLRPEGYIWLRGELWRAQPASGEEILEGDKVRVVNARGLTLIVEREEV
jgi:membrane-bound serine protease (ClpP class)